MFFQNYIKPGRPFLLKNGAKNQRAFEFWNDEYMKSFPEAATETVDVEPNLKEIREAEGFQVSFKEFLDRYHTDDIYMVNKVPTFLQYVMIYYLLSSLAVNKNLKSLICLEAWDAISWLQTSISYKGCLTNREF